MKRFLFRTARKLLAPSWLTSGDGELVGYSLDLLKDAFLERLRLGHLARFPENGPNGETAPSDALAAMGQDRRVIRGINEADADYAVRLKAYLDDRRKAGSPFMLMKQLAGYMGAGTSFRTVDMRGNWYSRSSAGVETSSLNAGNWTWDDSDATRWSRFWVIIYPGAVWTATTDDYGDVGLEWAELNHVWGLSATPDQIAAVRHIINDWKPAGTRCVEIVVALGANSFDPTAPEPDGTWGRWSTIVDGVAVPNRLTTARYLGGA